MSQMLGLGAGYRNYQVKEVSVTNNSKTLVEFDLLAESFMVRNLSTEVDITVRVGKNIADPITIGKGETGIVPIKANKLFISGKSGVATVELVALYI